MNSSQTGKLFYQTGELRYEGGLCDGAPYGHGVKYYKNGLIEMEGLFGDWFLEEGKEYYETGILKFEGRYNQGPRTYYGPRYFVEGNLYHETGEIWFSGTFKIERYGSIGYPRFLGAASFKKGIAFQNGAPKIYYV